MPYLPRVTRERGESVVLRRKGSRSRSVTATEVVPGGRLSREQRRVLLGLCIVLGAVTTVPASYNYVLIPMLHGLGASETQGSLVRQLPSIAGLLVIFPAGILGHQWGERRFITICGVLFTVGNAAVAIAPGMKVAAGGLVLESIGAAGFIVVGLALLSAQVSGDEARASAFATYATVGPIVYIAMPLLAGIIVDQSSWRLVAVVWALGGIVMLIASRLLLPPGDGPRESHELRTPVLAGVVLAATVQTVTFAHRDGVFSVAALVRLGMALVAFVVVYWIFRRTASPSLSLAALRRGGMSLLLIIVVLLGFANLWFYMTVAFQYLYRLDALQTAAVMLPAQAAAIGGAAAARRFLRTRGIAVTGTTMLAALAASLLLSSLITRHSPLWVPIVVISVYAAASVGAGIPLTNAVMNHAPEGEDGSASAFRSAASNVGAAVGVVVMSTIVFSTFSAALTSNLKSEGLNTKQSAQIAERLRDGASSEDVSADYSVPLKQVKLVGDAERGALVDGLRAHGLSGAAFTGVCLMIFYWSQRREKKRRRLVRPGPRD